MIKCNLDCMFLHDICDQYCNLFKGYKHCDKTECKVLDLLKENELLKEQISYLEDNLQVARKDNEQLQDTLAKEIEDFITEQPHTSLQFLANAQLKKEIEQLKVQNMKMRGCINCKHYHEYDGNAKDYYICELDECDNLSNWEIQE